MTDAVANPHINNAGYSVFSSGPGTEILAWKCPHFSVYSGIHTFSPEVPTDVVEDSKNNLLAYYLTVQPCDCIPVINPP